MPVSHCSLTNTPPHARFRLTVHLLVVIKALAALLAQPASINHIAQVHTRPILGIARLLVQHLHDSQAGIKTDEVRQLEGTHGHVGAVLHDGIDRIAVADARLKADDGLVDVRHQDAVGQEARAVLGDGGDLAQLLAELDGGVEGFLAGLQAADDLDALLDGDRVHEVRGHDARAVGGVVGVLGRGSGDARDGDGRRVGRQDGVLGADLGELGEDIKLKLGDLRHGLDHEVDAMQVVEARGGLEKGAGRVGLVLGDAVLGDVLA